MPKIVWDDDLIGATPAPPLAKSKGLVVAPTRDPALNQPPYARDKHPRWDGCADCNRVHMRTSDEDCYCKPCRERRNLPPVTTGDITPWYERMTAEELAVIRAKKWTGTTFKTDADGEIRIVVHRKKKQQEGTVTLPDIGKDTTNYDKPTAFNVRYRKTDGSGSIDLMVGKLIPHPQFGRVFFHAAADSGGEGQEHKVTDCPCPVDEILVEKLVELGVEYFYAYDRDAQMLYRADVKALAGAPAAIYAKNTIRTRRFLEMEQWRSLDGVREVVLDDRRTRNYLRGDRVILASPWANQEVTLGTDPVAI